MGTDFGFGRQPFGSGPFGRVNWGKTVTWDRYVPQGIKDDDAATGGDLEKVIDVFGDVLDLLHEQARAYPDMVDPLEALSGAENAQTLTVLSAAPNSEGFLVTFSEADRETLEMMWPHSIDSNGDERSDGWKAVIADRFYFITSVDSYSLQISVRTTEAIPATLEVRPPEILSLIGADRSILVDREDPPDYTRRAIYRHRLIRDLKVSGRLFEYLGRIYGFDVTVQNLYCISESTYNALIATDPDLAVSLNVAGVVKYFASAPRLTFNFDEVPADVMPVDSNTELCLDAVVGTSQLAVAPVGVPAGAQYWCIQINNAVWQSILSLGWWKLVDGNGDEYWIDETKTTAVADEDTTVDTNGTMGPYSVNSQKYPINPNSVVVKWTKADATQGTATDDGAGLLSGDGDGTVDYDTGAIIVTMDDFTDGGEATDWIPVTAGITTSWNDGYVSEPLVGAAHPDTSKFDGWVVGDDGWVIRSIDGGESWAAEAGFPFTDDSLNGVDGDLETTSGADVTVWVVSEARLSTLTAGGVWRWSETTGLWTAMTNAVANGLLDVAAFDGSGAQESILGVGYAGTMVYWDGATAMAQTGGAVTGEDLHAVSMEDTGSVWVVGSNGVVLEVTAWGGTAGDFSSVTWTVRTTLLGGGVLDDLNSVSFFNGDLDFGVIAGDNDQVWISIDAGVSWSASVTGLGKDWVDASWQGEIGGPPAYGDALLLTASDGTVIISTDAGATWSAHIVPTGTHVVRGGAWKELTPTVGSEMPYGLVVGESDLIWWHSLGGRYAGAGTTLAGSQAYASAGTYNFVVPPGVTSLRLAMNGGGGSGALIDNGAPTQTDSVGGAGGFVKATIAVTPGETLTFTVGEGGHDKSDYLGGFPGGGDASTVNGSGNTGGTGGGYSAVLRGGTVLAVAGAGGGGGHATTVGFIDASGGAGGAAAEPGGFGGGTLSLAGKGATPLAGGIKGAGAAALGSPGASLQGGDGFASASSTHGGGGGGGGYFGGGSGGLATLTGDAGGGGGGSSYVPDPTATDVVYLDGSGDTPGGVAEPEYQIGAGVGGAVDTAGADGAAYIEWDDGSEDPILLDYDTSDVCLIAVTQPVAGNGQACLIPRFDCNGIYRAAAAYLFTITPNEILTEPGASVERLIDRMEEKIDAYIPMHIRVVAKVFKSISTVALWGAGGPVISAQDTITDTMVTDLITGSYFDDVEADAQPVDTGLWFISSTLTVVP